MFNSDSNDKLNLESESEHSLKSGDNSKASLTIEDPILKMKR